jgi:phage-related protein
LKLKAVFYCTNAGNEPVRVWLKGLSKEDRKTIGEDIQTVQYGWPIGMPLVGTFGGGLFEVRSDVSDGRIARTLFMTQRGTVVLLHGFIKKAQTTPKPDLALAKKRKSEIEKVGK